MMLRVLSLIRSSAAYRVGGLARSRGSGDQHDPVRTLNELLHAFQRFRIHAQRFEVQPAGLFVQQPQDHALAVNPRQRGNADVDGPARDPQRNAAVLRQAFLGDVQVRHDLGAGDHQRTQTPAELERFTEYPVDAEAHAQVELARFQVNVGGAGSDSRPPAPRSAAG